MELALPTLLFTISAGDDKKRPRGLGSRSSVGLVVYLDTHFTYIHVVLCNNIRVKEKPRKQTVRLTLSLSPVEAAMLTEHAKQTERSPSALVVWALRQSAILPPVANASPIGGRK